MRESHLPAGFLSLLLPLTTLALSAAAADQSATVAVRNDASLRQALREAQPGTRIQILPGRYAPEVYAAGLQGSAELPIVIEGQDPADRPVFEGGRQGWHLSGCSYVTIRGLVIRGAKTNGMNIDDGGRSGAGARQITVEDVTVSDIGPRGNFDGIKMSGVDDFVVRRCTIEGWGGQAIDMVGCHRGSIEDCVFRGKDGFSQNAGPQMKGGSSEVRVQRCRFEGPIMRGVQLGGSTGLEFFRPRGANYEARGLIVEDCLFQGGDAAVTFVGVDGAVFRFNTIVRPQPWVLRILQETTAAEFLPCRNGRFERNLIVYRAGDLRSVVNVGSNTRSDTFTFADNLWYCEDRPARGQPDLPTTETNGVYGVDPQLTERKGWLVPQAAAARGFGTRVDPSKPEASDG